MLWYHDRAFIAHDGGKLDVVPREPVATSGRARRLHAGRRAGVRPRSPSDPELAGRVHDDRAHVAICTNGTRVLGLGDIGAARVDAGDGGQGDLLRAVRRHQPRARSSSTPTTSTSSSTRSCGSRRRSAASTSRTSRAPECFEIERRLIEALPQPVMHDDVHGTAVVTLARRSRPAVRSATASRGREVGQIGLGAAGFGIATLIARGGRGARARVRPDRGGARAGRARHGIEPALAGGGHARRPTSSSRRPGAPA